jgi:hypothetical protein
MGMDTDAVTVLEFNFFAGCSSCRGCCSIGINTSRQVTLGAVCASDMEQSKTVSRITSNSQGTEF